MNTCCNNIYPDEDLKRWETSCSVPYYTKSEIDEKLEDISISGGGITSGEVQTQIDASVEPIEGSVEALSGAVEQLSTDMENKADKSDIPSLENYYNKAEVNTIIEDNEYTISQAINDLNDRKLDASAYTPTDLSSYWTSAQTKNYVDNAISGIPSNILAVDWEGLTSNMNDDKWDSLVDAFQNNNPIYAIVDYSGEGFIDIDQKPIDGYVFIDGNTGEQGSRIELKRLTSDGYDLITITKNGSNDYTVTNGNVQYQQRLEAGSGIAINGNVISATGGGTDLSQYWTSAQTKDYVDNAISGIPSGALAVDWSELVDQQLMTDAKWNEIVTAIQNHREVYGYLDYSADGGGIDIYPLTSSANIGAQGVDDSIILNSQSGDGTYILTITKNGSNDYSFSDSGYSFQPKLTAGSGISISNNNVISVTGGTSGTIDQSLDSGSTNPVANSAITQAINAKADATNVYNKTEVNNLVSTKANVWCGSTAEFEALTNKDANTIYLVY